MKQHTRTHGPCGRPPSSESGERREHILESALNLFAAQGIAGTTIARIAGEAGVTSAMVHYYFTNREGLLDALVAERLAPAIAYIWAGISADMPAEPRDIVTNFVDRLLETVERIPQLPLLWSREVLNAGGLLRERVMAQVPVERFDGLRRFFAEARRRGELNPGVAPDFVFTSVMGVVLLPLVAQDIIGKLAAMPVPDRTLLRRHALAVLLEGLCPPSHAEEK